MKSNLNGTKALGNFKAFLSEIYHQRSRHKYQEAKLTKLIKKDNFGTIKKIMSLTFSAKHLYNRHLARC